MIIKNSLDSDEIDAIYCAVPHNLHEQIYIDIINAKKHLLGEKPFGIDKKANENILKAIRSKSGCYCTVQFGISLFSGLSAID